MVHLLLHRYPLMSSIMTVNKFKCTPCFSRVSWSSTGRDVKWGICLAHSTSCTIWLSTDWPTSFAGIWKINQFLKLRSHEDIPNSCRSTTTTNKSIYFYLTLRLSSAETVKNNQYQTWGIEWKIFDSPSVQIDQISSPLPAEQQQKIDLFLFNLEAKLCWSSKIQLIPNLGNSKSYK